MPVKREYKQISQRAKSLLSKPEGVDVDFKREINGIKSRDLVSFANSPQGGAILVGVDEYTNKNGLQRGQVVGCDVDDSARLSLINKATDCYPDRKSTRLNSSHSTISYAVFSLKKKKKNEKRCNRR